MSRARSDAITKYVLVPGHILKEPLVQVAVIEHAVIEHDTRRRDGFAARTWCWPDTLLTWCALAIAAVDRSNLLP